MRERLPEWNRAVIVRVHLLLYLILVDRGRKAELLPTNVEVWEDAERQEYGCDGQRRKCGVFLGPLLGRTLNRKGETLSLRRCI